MRFDYTASTTRSQLEIVATTTASRARLTINGAAWAAGAAFPAQLETGVNHFELAVASPDGSVTNRYTLDLSLAAAPRTGA